MRNIFFVIILILWFVIYLREHVPVTVSAESFDKLLTSSTFFSPGANKITLPPLVIKFYTTIIRYFSNFDNGLMSNSCNYKSIKLPKCREYLIYYNRRLICFLLNLVNLAIKSMLIPSANIFLAISKMPFFSPSINPIFLPFFSPSINPTFLP